MEIFAIILSSLALLAAASNLVITLRERKRSQKRNTALIKYAETCAGNVRSDLGLYIDEHLKRQDERLNQIATNVENLSKGVVPDFEKAKEAANAVNQFHAGITGILGFDPYEALKKQREDNFGGEHD